MPTLPRRTLLAGLAGSLAMNGARGAVAAPLLARPWLDSGVELPLLGLGTWQAFDVAPGSPEAAQAALALQRFDALGGRLVDSSPMYGRAEAAVGAALRTLPQPQRPWLASKVWTRGAEAGAAQLRDTLRHFGRAQVELMQIHNLLDAETQFELLRRARDAGTVRWIGVSHYTASAHAELQRWGTRPGIDAVQVNYSLAEPEAGRRLLPALAAAGRAVIVNRPFAEGAMFERVRGQALPPIAAELGCRSHAQLFLKWLYADPAVSCVLAGTRKPAHVEDNLAATRGPLPDAAQRLAIERWCQAA